VRLAAQLSERRGEIKDAVQRRVFAISAPATMDKPEYEQGLRAAISDALDYAIDSVETGEEKAPPIPATLLTQARLAARNGVDLDAVLRRYVAGNAIFADFLLEEAEGSDFLVDAALKRLMRSQSVLVDRLLTAICEEHKREAASRLHTAEQRRRDRVQRLLDGELLDGSDLAYDLDASHLAVVASGAGAADALRIAARALDRRPLIVAQDKQVVWAWFGGRARTEPDDVQRVLASNLSDVTAFATGESANGRSGWRQTHLQAQAALPFARRRPGHLVRYAEVALAASLRRDDLVTTSLDELFMAPLEGDADDGTLLEALRAFFASDRRVSSTAAKLKVSRPTVSKRLQVVEARLGRPIHAISVELEIALRLRDFERPTTT
jgi:DNA-binding PucR family transcriptional regulator